MPRKKIYQVVHLAVYRNAKNMSFPIYWYAFHALDLHVFPFFPPFFPFFCVFFLDKKRGKLGEKDKKLFDNNGTCSQRRPFYTLGCSVCRLEERGVVILLLALVIWPLTTRPFETEHRSYAYYRDTSNVLELITCFPCITLLTTISPSCFAVCSKFGLFQQRRARRRLM